MRILLVAATYAEVKKTLDDLIPAGADTYYYKGNRIDVLITGPGMVATAFVLGKKMSQHSYHLAIQAGIAGAFDKKVPLGSVLHVVSDRVSGMGAEDGEAFLSLRDIGLENEDTCPPVGEELINHMAFQLPEIEKLPSVKAITVNTVHGNEKSIERIVNQYEPGIESMEGAAFFYACFAQNVPCIQIRSVSNHVERRNRESWNIPLALENLHTVLLRIFDSLSK